MRPANTSDSLARYLPATHETAAEDDTMLMGFEFFDETGRLNPRKILFTEKTCPNKAQRVLSHLFGRIMKWNACRWAENFLKNTQINQAALAESSKQQVISLLHDIRTTGVVSMPRLFSFVATVANETKTSDTQNDQKIIHPQASSQATLPSTSYLINHEEVAQQFQLQRVDSDHETASATAAITNDTAADHTYLIEACQVVETQWQELSKINDGDLAPPQFKLPVKSGFLDFCRHASVKQTTEQAAEQAMWCNRFAEMDEKQWSRYQNIMTTPQYQAWTNKRHKWIELLSKRAQSPSEKKAPERDLHIELKTEQPVFDAKTELTVAQVFSNYSADFMRTSHGKGRLPLPVEEILDSGFINYCDFGVAAFQHIDVDVLEKFLKKYQTKWDIFGKIMTPSQFAQLKKHRDQVAQDIADFRANYSSTVNVSTKDISAENDRLQTDIDDIQNDKDNVAGLFSEVPIISVEYLKQIDWNATDLHRKINLDDAKKLRNYFSSAEVSPENIAISKKIERLSRKIREIAVFEKHALGTGKASNVQSNLQEAGDVLAGVYGSYLRRYTSASRVQNTTSNIEKLSEKNSTKINRSALKKKPRKHIKAGKKTAPQKSAEKQLTIETKTPTQEAREQIKEANALIARMNEKYKN